MSLFGAGHLDCICNNNTCSACIWIRDYYASHPELNARKIVDRYGYVSYRAPIKDNEHRHKETGAKDSKEPKPTKFVLPSKPQPFLAKQDPAMRIVPAKEP